MTTGGRALLAAVAAAACVAQPSRAQEPTLFTFRAGFWLHLHHFLYVLGRAENGTKDSARRAVAGAPAEQAEGLARASPEEAMAWRAAVDVYKAGPSRLDVVFDEELWRAAGALASLRETDPIATAAVPAAMRDALAQAAPVYRRLWWPAHGRGSRTHIDALQTWLRLDGGPIASIIASAVGQSWPTGGYRAEVVAYANWAGAYSIGGGLLVVSSRDPGTGDSSGLEILFHEAMHQWDEALDQMLRDAAGRTGGARIPPGLSHALVFYTAGEAVRRVIASHTPYAESNGMWDRGPMARFKVPLDRYWGPYVRRGTGAAAAVDGLLLALQ